MKPLFDAVVLTVKLNIAKAINLYLLGGEIGLSLRAARLVTDILGQQSEEESKQAMTNEEYFHHLRDADHLVVAAGARRCRDARHYHGCRLG